MEKLENTVNEPYITVIKQYTTFGGAGKSVYRTKIRKGNIPYAEMENLYSEGVPGGSFEIVEVTEDTVSFVVDGEYFDSGRDEIHTLPIRNGAVVFKRCEECSGCIEGDDFTYEVTSTFKVCTAKRVLHMYVDVLKETQEGTKWDEYYRMLPYAPGSYDLGDEYPFCKNVYTGPDTGYTFKWLHIDEDHRIRYLDKDYMPKVEGGSVLAFERRVGNETIKVCIYEETGKKTLKDYS